MFVVTVASQKGGVGKTTVSLNLAFALAKKGWRTLLVDADPQGAIGFSLSEKMIHARGLFDVLTGRARAGDVLLPTRLHELSLLPVGKDAITEHEAYQSALDSSHAISSLLDSFSADYDIILVDTPGGLSPITKAWLAKSDYVLNPVQAHPLAMRTIGQLLAYVGMLRSTRGAPDVLGVLMTMFDSSNEICSRAFAELEAALPHGILFDTRIPTDNTFLTASAVGVPVGLLSRRPPEIAKSFDALAAEIEGRMPLEMEGHDEPISLLV